MNREIQFRIWDGEQIRPVASLYFGHKIIYVETEDGGRIHIDPDEDKYRLLQFTGLYDTTGWRELTETEREKWVREGNMPSEWQGRPIYEGDILLGGMSPLGRKFGVVGHGVFDVDDDRYPSKDHTAYGWIVRDVNARKIRWPLWSAGYWLRIGNMFENKDLLEMENRIKFRIWDGERMWPVIQISMDEVGMIVRIEDGRYLDPDHFPLMQYTGLKDRNGVEIYEGDLVQLLPGALPPCEVKWEDATSGWSLYEGMPDDEYAWHEDGEWHSFPQHGLQVEAIGNIYDNPELLAKPRTGPSAVFKKPHDVN